MALALYMDHQVPKAISQGLSFRAVDVLTAYEDGRGMASDPEILDRATELRRILFTQDDDLLQEAAARQRRQAPFAGVIYAHQLKMSIGACVRDLEVIAKAGTYEEMESAVLFLPL